MQAYKTSKGKWQINFSEGGKQKTLYLGRDFTSGSADRVARIITDILAHRKRGEVLPVDLFRRIESLSERLRKSFERSGLVGGIASWTLDSLLQSFYESKSHLKSTTQDAYKMFGRLLLDFFTPERRIVSIEKSDCERFKAHLLKKYSACTVSRGIRRCRSFFQLAVNVGWLSRNPFEKVFGSVEVNLNRQVYVDREMIGKVMACCRDDYDRLLLALARFGGLRIPSEIRHLRYSDFTENVIRIHQDTKTGAREVPFFGEIREIFVRLQSLCPAQKNFPNCINSASELVFVNLGNFRGRVVSAIRASGVEQWAKLFVNLRSSCITDAVERGYKEKTLDSIFGNSAVVRSRHYVQFRKDKEYAKVLQDNERSLQMLREGVEENVFSKMEIDELLVLRDLLVNRFGTGRKVG